jgi:hypothetical protein
MFIIVAMIKKVISSQATIPPTTVEREHDALHEFQNNSLSMSFFKKKKQTGEELFPLNRLRKRKKRYIAYGLLETCHPMQRDTGVLKPGRGDGLI